MSSNIRIIVDSTFGITEEYARDNCIEVVRLKMILDNKIYEEGFEDTWYEFYDDMKNSKSWPTTSQPSPQDFVEAINRIYKDNKNSEIIILTIAGTLSGTINAATLATKEFEGKKIIAIDSRQATVCGRMLVEEIMEYINAGKSYEDILEVIPKIQEALAIEFIPANMDSLKRGGRISLLGATIANFLNIKPLFRFKQSSLTVLKKVIGLPKALTEAVLSLPKKIKKLYLCYIHDNTLISKLETKLKEKLGLDNLKTLALGPVFGVHIGIGSIGIATLEEY